MSIQAREIERITKAVFRSMFGWGVRPINRGSPSTDTTRVGSSFQVSGRWTGEVSVMCSAALARRAAGILFVKHGHPPSDREMFDAVREIARRVGDDLTSPMVSGWGPDVSTVTTSGGGVPRAIKPSLVFDCDGEPCWVLVDAVENGMDAVQASGERRSHERARKRGFERVGVDLDVTVLAQDRRLTHTHARNLSMNGVFVECATMLPRGTDCDVVVHGRDKGGVHVSGRVARNATNGFAVEFLEVDLDSYGLLRDVVMANATPAGYGTSLTEQAH